MSAPERDDRAHYELMRDLMGKAWADWEATRRSLSEVERQARDARRRARQETFATLTKGPWKPPH